MVAILFVIMACCLVVYMYRLIWGKRRKKPSSLWSSGGASNNNNNKNQDEESSSSSSSSISSDINVPARRATEKDKIEVQINEPKSSENANSNKVLELNEKASVHSVASDSLDGDVSTLSNQQSSNLTQEFPSEATTRRYVNLKNLGTNKTTPEDKDKESIKKDVGRGFHHQNCKFSGFNIRKNPK